MALLPSNRPNTIQSTDSSRQLRQRAIEKLESDSSRQLRQRAMAKLEARLTCVPETPTPAQAHTLLKELRVHLIELEMQNEELRRTQADLEIFRARYFDLHERAPVGYLTVNEEGVILEANLPASVLFGMNRSILVRRNFSQCIESADRDIYYLTRNHLLKTGASHVSEFRMRMMPITAFWRIKTAASPIIISTSATQFSGRSSSAWHPSFPSTRRIGSTGIRLWSRN